MEFVKNAMMQVVNMGTGYAARLPGIEVCGKTGTAQTASDAYMKAHHLKNNAWFVGLRSQGRSSNRGRGPLGKR